MLLPASLPKNMKLLYIYADTLGSPGPSQGTVVPHIWGLLWWFLFYNKEMSVFTVCFKGI